MKKWHNGLKLLAIVLSLSLAVPFSVISAVAASATTKIKHKSPKEYVPGFRINLDAEIKDDVGVLVARCYFKAKKDKNFVFVDMVPISNPNYRATLPAPWVKSEAVEYVFVVVNKEKKVVRSQIFSIKEKETEEAAFWKGPGEVKEIRLDVVQEVIEDYEVLRKRLVAEYRDKLSEWQEARARGQIDVKTELEKAPDQLKGFYDSFVVTEVPASMKYGLLAEGLYTKEQIAAAGGQWSVESATGAASAGTVSAKTGGLSTLAYVGIGAAALAGGAAAAGGGGGGGHHDGGGGPINVNASVEWGDSGPAYDDAFKVWFANRYLGESPLGGSSGTIQVDGLEVGTHQLRIEFSQTTTPGDYGAYYINLGGGATFSGGGTYREERLDEVGDRHNYNVIVPSP